jgi:hypothetical protein
MPLRKFVSPQAFFLMILLMSGFVATAAAQEASGPSQPSEASLRDSIREMQTQIQQLRDLVQTMKTEADGFHTETLQLKRELQLTRERLDALDLSAKKSAAPAPGDIAQNDRSAPQLPEHKTLAERISKLEDDLQLNNDKIDDQYQTKVESASKYRVKLSGILLMNVFSNKGNVDHFEVPGVAMAAPPSGLNGNSGGGFGATFRQSEIGLEVHGPSFAGARTSGNFAADFFGEFPETNNGQSSGSLRLKTGTLRLDWNRTSVVAGVDSLFFSPEYPTSWASVGVPAFSYSGNLWGWIPQVRIEHSLIASDTSTLKISGGILDPFTGETPPNEFLRLPGAGESSRQPGYATRVEWTHKVGNQPLTLGAGGFYERQNWGFNRNVDGWAATVDWIIPFGDYVSLSGKFYDGSAIGGLGGGIGRSIVFNGALENPASPFHALASTGGWSQLKIKPATKLEFNLAAGQDGAAAGDVRGFTEAPGYFAATLFRNRSELVNFVYRPRSNLLFSTEFRTLRTFDVNGTSQRANQLNLVMGVLF